MPVVNSPFRPPTSGSYVGAALGVAAQGISRMFARRDHVHPVQFIETCLAYKQGADFNVTTDQALTMNFPGVTKWLVTEVRIGNVSVSLTTAQGGIYTAASKGGTAIVAASQAYTALNATNIGADVAITAAGLMPRTISTLFLALTTAQGAAATGDVYVMGVPVP